MIYAVIENGVVVQCDRTPDIEAPEGYIEAPDWVCPGVLFDGDEFTMPDPPAPVVIVPPVISDRQFFQALAGRSIITRAEALAAVKTGSVPPAMQTMVDALPEAERFAADMLLSGATTFSRSHPLTAVFGAAFGWTDAEIDEFWIEAYSL